MTATWPLSAAATALLVRPRTDAHEVLRLSVKELLLSGTWRLERVRPARRLRGRGDGLDVRPLPGSPPPRPPLPHLERVLRSESPDGGPLRGVVERAVKADRRLAQHLREQALDELVRLGLQRVERRRVLGFVPRTSRSVTRTGEAWAASPAQLRSGWADQLRAGAGAVVLAHAASAPGLLLGGDRELLALLDAELDRLRDRGELDAPWVVMELDGGLRDLSSGVDSAVDGGSSDGGGTGDGGDGGGGGD